MDLQSEGGGGAAASPSRDPDRPRRRASAVPLRARLWLAGGGLAALALIVALFATQSGAAHSAAAAAGRVSSASPATFERALVARLRAQRAYFHWVACVRSGFHFEGAAVVRCNVDFGDPHIQAYCSVFRGGRLLTSEDDSAIPCGHDNAGYKATIVTYG